MRYIRQLSRHVKTRNRATQRATSAQTPPPAITGTVKSIEVERGTGSIAPDVGCAVEADTGFARTVVAEGRYDALHVGDRVRFDAEPDPSRPGFATALRVEPDGGS